jgi:hypothetical protein
VYEFESGQIDRGQLLRSRQLLKLAFVDEMLFGLDRDHPSHNCNDADEKTARKPEAVRPPRQARHQVVEHRGHFNGKTASMSTTYLTAEEL